MICRPCDGMGLGNPFADTSTFAVNLNHFRLLRVVGKGAFGKVRIVERKDTGLTFALKYIRKEEGGNLCDAADPAWNAANFIFCSSVVRSESVRNIIRERRMLEHLNHPFLCNLRYSFQDMEYMYVPVPIFRPGETYIADPTLATLLSIS